MVDLSHLVISDSAPSGVAPWENFVWIDTAKKKINKYQNGKWVAVADFTVGVTSKVKIASGILIFKNGVLTKIDKVETAILPEVETK